MYCLILAPVVPELRLCLGSQPEESMEEGVAMFLLEGGGMSLKRTVVEIGMKYRMSYVFRLRHQLQRRYVRGGILVILFRCLVVAVKWTGRILLYFLWAGLGRSFSFLGDGILDSKG